MKRTAYVILGVAATAPPEVVKAAKTALSKIYHPDNGTAPDADAMAEVNGAYDILTDPTRRATHDAEIAAGGFSDEPLSTDGSGWGDDPVAPESGEAGWGDEPGPPPPPPPPPGTAAATRPPPPVPAPTATPVPRNAREHGWYSAIQLAQLVRAGHPLPTQPTTLILGQGEVYHCGINAAMMSLHRLDGVTYNSNMFIAGRTMKGMIATGAASMVWNSHNKRKAQRQAALQWRNLGTVPLHITNQRLMIAIEGQLSALWFQDSIMMFDPQYHHFSMQIQPQDGSLLRFDGDGVPYAAVMLNVLLRGEAPSLP